MPENITKKTFLEFPKNTNIYFNFIEGVSAYAFLQDSYSMLPF